MKRQANHVVRPAVAGFIIAMVSAAAIAADPVSDATATQIKNALATLNINAPGKQGQVLLDNWDDVMTIYKHPTQFPADIKISDVQIDLLDKFKRKRFYDLQEQFLQKLAKEDPKLLAKLRGFMKTGSWAKLNNPNYVKLLSDFDMTVVCDDPVAERLISEKLNQFLADNDFKPSTMNYTVFPVPAGAGQDSEVYKGGAKKFVDVYNETEGRFDAVQFDKNGRYRALVRDQSPEASFGVVYDASTGKKVAVVQDFARFTAKDAPDLMLKEQEDFAAFIKKIGQKGELTQSDMKKIGKFASRSAYGKKILLRSPTYPPVARKAFDLKWNNVNPEELLADRINHFVSTGKAGSRNAAVQMAYREYLHEAGEMIHRNADVAVEVKRFGFALADEVAEKAPLYARIFQQLDKLQYVTAIYAIWQTYSTAKPEERATCVSFTTAKELAEMKMPGLTWPFLSATITHASLSATATAVYDSTSQAAAKKMFEGIFEDSDLLRMKPNEIETKIDRHYDDIFDNAEAIGGWGNAYPQWREGSREDMKERVYWVAMKHRGELAIAYKQQQRIEQHERDMQRILEALGDDARQRRDDAVDLAALSDTEGSLPDLRQAEANEAKRLRDALAHEYAMADKRAEQPDATATPAMTDDPITEPIIIGAGEGQADEALQFQLDKQTPEHKADRTGYHYVAHIARAVDEPDQVRWFVAEPTLAKEHTSNGQSLGGYAINAQPDPDLAAVREMFYAGFRDSPTWVCQLIGPDGKALASQAFSLGWSGVNLRVEHGYKSLDGAIADIDARTEQTQQDCAPRIKELEVERGKAIAKAQQDFNALKSADKKRAEFEMEGCDLKRRFQSVRKVGHYNDPAAALRKRDPDDTSPSRMPDYYTWEASGKRDEVLPASACQSLRDEITRIEQRSFDPTSVQKEYEQRIARQRQQRDKRLADLTTRKSALGSDDRKLADAAKQAMRAAADQVDQSTPARSRNYAAAMPNRAVLITCLINLVAHRQFDLRFSVAAVPGMTQFGQAGPPALGYLSGAGLTHVPVTRRDAAFTVRIVSADGGEVLHEWTIPILDEDFAKRADGDREAWRQQVKQLNDKVTKFLNNYSGETSPQTTALIEQLKGLYSPDDAASPEQVYARLGIQDAYKQARATAAAALAEGTDDGRARAAEAWSKLADAAGKRIYGLASRIDTARGVAASGARARRREAAPGVASADADIQQLLDSGRDPNQLVREVQLKINDETRQTLTAMDFNQDCADRVRIHMDRLGSLLDQLIAILEAIDVKQQLDPGLRNELLTWASENLQSQRNLLAAAGKIADTSIPDIPANLTSKYRARFEKQRTTMTNMKKTYAACMPTTQRNRDRFARIVALLGGSTAPPPKSEADKADEAARRAIREKARKQILELQGLMKE